MILKSESCHAVRWMQILMKNTQRDESDGPGGARGVTVDSEHEVEMGLRSNSNPSGAGLQARELSNAR